VGYHTISVGDRGPTFHDGVPEWNVKLLSPSDVAVYRRGMQTQTTPLREPQNSRSTLFVFVTEIRRVLWKVGATF